MAQFFFSGSSEAFLSPVFGKTLFSAQYYGIKEAATRVHDQHIGIEKDVFHLFRLPEMVEIALHGLLEKPEIAGSVQMILANRDEAEQFLQEYAKDLDSSEVGPVRLGDATDISKREIWQTATGYYSKAIQGGNQNFPVFFENSMNKRGAFTSKLGAGLGLVEEILALLDLWGGSIGKDELYQKALESGRFPNVSATRLGTEQMERIFTQLDVMIGDSYGIPEPLRDNVSTAIKIHDFSQDIAEGLWG